MGNAEYNIATSNAEHNIATINAECNAASTKHTITYCLQLLTLILLPTY